MEGIHPADASAWRELFALLKKNPYVLRLAFSAGIGGLLFGYDTGVISGALLYIRDDYTVVDKKTWLQGMSAMCFEWGLFTSDGVMEELIVSMAVAGAIIGAAIGGWTCDRFGRKISIIVADILFFAGAILMAVAPNPSVIIVGRAFVGLGVGMASMTAPLYISEASPHNIRGALVSLNGFLITGGQFLSYIINLAFTEAPHSWRWMLGVAGLPALIQFGLMFFLPESPRWLYRQGKGEEANTTLRKLYPADQVEQEIQDLKDSVEKEAKEDASSEKYKFVKLFQTKSVRRALLAGVMLQVFQQLVGINTVMYYSPTIVQLAGIASNQTALRLSLITSSLNAAGTIVSITFIDKTGRKKLLVYSLCGVIVSLALLTGVFNQTEKNSPPVGFVETAKYSNFTCPAYQPSDSWDCMRCLKAPDCGFCASSEHKLRPGACVITDGKMKDACKLDHSLWYTKGCPSKYGWLALVGLALYIMSFSPGMGTVPWIVNSEIYPLRYRGVCGGIAATANWISNLFIAQTFLTFTEVLGTGWTFFGFGVVAFVGLIFVLVCVPETKGLHIEEVENMLDQRALHYKFWKKDPKPIIQKGSVV
ncbi:hypothetical protein IFM89_013230 [Coptis chinensis]|uniref:Major facilitator superfamily (MFS) profile domain-containing protein n=1 Tax=Coptis chinensis TaxID=261450 RepID=A0A835IMJ4_9MAGN|nr:hypothetical protein IFM89_013230 [Coptis chinensis]